MVPKKLQRKDPVTGYWEEVEGDVQPHLRIEITKRFVDVPEDELEKYLQLGYVITVHKAQGSDWPTVLLAQPGKVRDDTAKKFWYTSITRAKNRLIILSGLKTIGWWQNASMDAPDQPSTLMKRLARPLLPSEFCEMQQGTADVTYVVELIKPHPVPAPDQFHCVSETPEIVKPWRTLRQKSAPVHGDYPHQAGDQTAPPSDHLDRIRAEFRALALEVW